MLTVKDAEHLVMLISIVGGFVCTRVWSVAVVAVIAGLLFPTLLTLFVSPYWKRLGFERYFEMQAGNFIALAAYYMRYLLLAATYSGVPLGPSSDWSGDGIGLLTKEKVQNESDEGASSLRQGRLPLKP